MKRIFAIVVSTICLSICSQNKTYAQENVYLVSNPQTARWSYIETDSKGQMTATYYYSVESLKGDGVNGNIKLRVEEVPVSSPKDTVKSAIFYCFKDGELMADITSGMADDLLGSSVDDIIKERGLEFSEEQRKEVLEEVQSILFKTTGEIRGIPRYPKVGKLPDYEFNFKFSIVSIKVQGKERSIVGTERIQTYAGSFDCFIMEETISTKSMMMKDVERTRSWYAYGFGLVKEITYDKNGKMISSMILNEVNY